MTALAIKGRDSQLQLFPKDARCQFQRSADPWQCCAAPFIQIDQGYWGTVNSPFDGLRLPSNLQLAGARAKGNVTMNWSSMSVRDAAIFTRLNRIMTGRHRELATMCVLYSAMRPEQGADVIAARSRFEIYLRRTAVVDWYAHGYSSPRRTDPTRVTGAEQRVVASMLPNGSSIAWQLSSAVSRRPWVRIRLGN